MSLRIEVKKDVVRSELNLMYAMSRLLVTVLDMADNPVARETLLKVAEGVFDQAAILYNDIAAFTSVVGETE